MRPNNKYPKYFGKRPHRRLATPRGCEWIRPVFTPSNTLFLGSIESAPNGISIGSVVFVGLTNVTKKQTHKPTTLPCLYDRPHQRVH